MTYSTRIDLPPAVRDRVIPLLQARLSDALDLEAQLKQAHWNVKGQHFFQLHTLFDQLHTEIEDFVDTIAERIVSLGGVADGRVQTTSQQTSLALYPLAAERSNDHLVAIASALATFAATVRQDIDTTSAAGDQGSADLLTGMSRAADKHLWLVEAHLTTPTR